MIYLTSDADKVIENIYHDKVYIIGAVVDPEDKERKNLTKKRAEAHGIECRRFPTIEGIDNVLNIRDCVMIMCKYMELKNMDMAVNETFGEN